MLLCYQLARAFGGTPDSYRDMEQERLSFNRLALQVGQAWEADQRAQLPPRAVQPVIVVG